MQESLVPAQTSARENREAVQERVTLCLPGPEVAQGEKGGWAKAQFLLWLVAPSSGHTREARGILAAYRSPSMVKLCLLHPVPCCHPTHLQVAGRGCVVDLDIAVVGAGQQLTISEP